MPATVRAIRRVNRRLMESEVVSARDSRAIIASRRRPRRPPVAVLASVPESTSSHGRVNEPAAHEVKRGSCNIILSGSNTRCQPILTQHILEATRFPICLTPCSR